jgi:hypothetical protein
VSQDSSWSVYRNALVIVAGAATYGQMRLMMSGAKGLAGGWSAGGRACVLAVFSVSISSGFLACMLSSVLAFLLACFLACMLAFLLSFVSSTMTAPSSWAGAVSAGVGASGIAVVGGDVGGAPLKKISRPLPFIDTLLGMVHLRSKLHIRL